MYKMDHQIRDSSNHKYLDIFYVELYSLYNFYIHLWTQPL